MIRIVLFLAFGFLLASCGDDEEVTLRGSDYQLVRISGGIAGVNDDFSTDAVFWSFSADDDLVITKMTSRLHSGPLEGEYKYDYANEILRFGADDTSQEEWQSLGVNLSITGDTLFLEDGLATDGFLYTFYRR
jgi:hypothetical protein